ncbi:MAG: glycosyltransferase family 2 protein [Gemmataceae bacterium]|nr:glycosyltransferase family 2 protein [Gemmataceae bacterium]
MNNDIILDGRRGFEDSAPATPPTGFHELVHALNQRCRAEFDRAERLQAELDDIKESRAWIIFQWLRSLRRWLGSSALGAPASPPGSRGAARLAAPTEVGVSTPLPKVSILIPFKDQLGLLRNCLRSLRRGAYRRLEIVLLDNGSTAPDMLRYLECMKRRRGFRVVDCPGDFNFARICNLGSRQASGSYLLFLNNDVEVLTPEWLERMLALAENPRVGVVGSTLLYPDGTIQHAGIEQLSNGLWRHAYRGSTPDSAGADFLQVRCVPAVTAACLLMRRDRFFELGGFDERYPVTHNDVDLCRRVRERGWLVVVTPHARLMHFESLSRGYSRQR